MHEHQWDPVAAVRAADWESILPNLLAYAAWLLRPLGSTKSTEGLGAAAEDLVHDAVMRVLRGSRRYHGSGPPNLEYLLRGAMKSIASDRKKQAGKRSQVAEFDDEEVAASHVVDECERIEEAHGFEDERLKHIEEVIAQDDEFMELYLAIDKDHLKRSEIAAATGWSPDKVSVVMKRLKRALQRKGEGGT